MMSRKFILLLIYQFSFLLTVAQNSKITESLLLEVESYPRDSVYMEKIKQIAINHPNPMEGLSYAKRFFEIADSLNFPVKVAEAYEEIALKQRLLGNQSASLEASLSALRLYESLDMDINQGAINDQIGVNYVINEQYQTGIK